MNDRKRNLVTFAGLVTALVFAVGTGKPKPSGTTTSASSSSSSTTTSSSAGTTAKGGGVLSFEVKPTQHSGLDILHSVFVGPDYPGAKLVGLFNDALVFPNNVVERVRDCGTINSFYSPDDHSVNLCYELAGFYYEFFDKNANLRGRQSSTQMMIRTMTFTQLHESGHMLIKELGIGAMGNEETDVDGFATVFLLEAKAPDMAIDGALAMISLLQLSGPKPQYFDEHPPSQERFAEILCLVYGSDPAGQAGLIAAFPPLAARSQKCVGEFNNTVKVWDELLAPHSKKKH
jgi:hypothetical protein